MSTCASRSRLAFDRLRTRTNAACRRIVARHATIIATIVATTAVVAACGGQAAAPTCAVTSVVVAPNAANVAVGDTLRLNSTLSQTNCTNLTVTWESNNPAVASVSAAGTVTGVTVGGPVQVVARAGTVSSAAAIVVIPQSIASIGLTIANAVLDEGQSAQVTATVRDSRGNSLTGRTLTWSTSNAAVAVVDTNGRVTGVSAGGVTISARDPANSTVSASITVTVRGVVATVVVSPASGSVVVGRTLALVATVRNAAGIAITDRTIIWTTSSPAIASVTAAGVVAGVAVGGPVTIRATADGVSGSAVITVTLEPVVSVVVVAGSTTISVGQTTQATATLRDAQGNVLTGRSIVWTSGSVAVAAVNATGLIAAVATGTATITATSEGRSGSTTMTITPAAVTAANRLGYALVDGATATTNAAFTDNIAGGSVTVMSLGVGHWRVGFQQLGRAAGQSDVALVTPAANAHCVIDNWAPSGVDMNVEVRCFAIPGFAPTSATSFSVMLVGNTVFQARSAFVWANQPTGNSYAPSASNAYTSAGSAISLLRTAPGTYESRLGVFPRPGGFGGQPEVPLVSTVAAGGTTVHCESEGADVDAASGLTYQDCRGTNDAHADAQYTLLVFSGGRAGKSWGFGYFAEDTTFNFSQFQKQSNGAAITFGAPNANGGRDVRMAAVTAGRKRGILITPTSNTDIGGLVTEWVSCGFGSLAPGTGTYEVICRNATGAIVISDFTIVVVE